MSNFGLSNKNLEKVSLSGFPVAIDNECTLEKCEYVLKGSNNLEAIEFTYLMDNGSAILRQKQTIFAVNENTVKQKEGKTMEESIASAWAKNVNNHLHHIATKLNCNQNELDNVTGSNFKEYATNYCNLITNKLSKNSPKLYLKTYLKNGYTAVSKYPEYLQRVDSGVCKLAWTNEELTANNVLVGNGVMTHTEEYV